ncbi:MAG: hypothetical protein HS124_08455 [Anaerolineales bacterium]|nr:hypothetical protein [Anaerolineales bacterium]
MVVHVEQERYNGINETPEGEVKDAIRGRSRNGKRNIHPVYDLRPVNRAVSTGRRAASATSAAMFGA